MTELPTDLEPLNMKGGEGDIVPTEKWVVRWKKNRNHRGEEEVSRREAVKLADEKRSLGYKVTMKKAPRSFPARRKHCSAAVR